MHTGLKRISLIIKQLKSQVNSQLFKPIFYSMSQSNKNKNKVIKTINTKNTPLKYTKDVNSQANTQSQKQKIRNLGTKKQFKVYKDQPNINEDMQIFKESKNKNVILISDISPKRSIKNIVFLMAYLPLFTYRLVVSTEMIMASEIVSLALIDVAIVLCGFYFNKLVFQRAFRFNLKIITKIQLLQKNVFVIQYRYRSNQVQKIVQNDRLLWMVDQSIIPYNPMQRIYLKLVQYKIFRKKKIPFQNDPGIWCIINGQFFWVSQKVKINPELKHLLIRYMPPQQNSDPQQKQQKTKNKIDKKQNKNQGKQ